MEALNYIVCKLRSLSPPVFVSQNVRFTTGFMESPVNSTGFQKALRNSGNKNSVAFRSAKVRCAPRSFAERKATLTSTRNKKRMILSRLKRVVLRILVLATLVASDGQIAWAQLIYSNDFEDDPVGIYSAENLKADWNSPTGSNGVDQKRVSIVTGPQAWSSGKSLAVRYPARRFGSGDNETGAQWKLDFGRAYSAVELEYRLKFGAGFDFVRGGKLPGLIGGVGNVGGNKPNGKDGFSARMMWRTNGSSRSRLKSDRANIVQYVYHVDQPDEFGEDFRWDDGDNRDWKRFESDRWYHIRHRVFLNRPGKSDGAIQAWLDNELVLNVSGIRFRTASKPRIDQFYFSTFFGGGSSKWATSKDEIAYFDDFRITAIPRSTKDKSD